MQSNKKRFPSISVIGAILLVLGLLFMAKEIMLIKATGEVFLVTDRALWALILMVTGSFSFWAQSIMAMQDRLCHVQAQNEAVASQWMRNQATSHN